MKYERIDFFKFQELFKSEQECREKLFRMKWPNGFRCPRCGHVEYYFLETRKLYQCKGCKHQTSVTAGTIMHRTKIPLIKWFWAIFLVSNDKRGISALALSKQLNSYYRPTWLMLSKIRVAMKDRDSMYKLKGLIEIDEVMIGSSSEGKGKAGRGSDKTPVIVAISTNGESVFYAKMNSVKSVNQEEIRKLIIANIVEDQIVKTDGFSAYKIIEKMGIKHETHIVSKSTQKAHDLLKWVHVIGGNLKAWLNGTFHGIDKKHLSSYLDEFCYRLNRRFHEEELFDRLLMACVESKGITYTELTA